MYVNSAKNSGYYKMVQLVAVALIALLLLPAALANRHESYEQDSKYTLERAESIKYSSLNVILISLLILTLFTGLSVLQRKTIQKNNTYKTAIFSILAATVIITTLYSAGSTIYLNVISETKGPVHWHADFDIWDCGREVDLINPTGISNRVGTPTLHEHGENRIHVEGVIIQKKDVNLHNFFRVVGGNLEKGFFSLPTDTGVHEMRDGNYCNGQKGMLQVFVYKVENPKDRKNWIYSQTKIADYPNYILASDQNVPPGDCIIIEYDREKSRTDKICETFKLSEDKGELNGR